MPVKISTTNFNVIVWNVQSFWKNDISHESFWFSKAAFKQRSIQKWYELAQPFGTLSFSRVFNHNAIFGNSDKCLFCFLFFFSSSFFLSLANMTDDTLISWITQVSYIVTVQHWYLRFTSNITTGKHIERLNRFRL